MLADVSRGCCLHCCFFFPFVGHLEEGDLADVVVAPEAVDEGLGAEVASEDEVGSRSMLWTKRLALQTPLLARVIPKIQLYNFSN